MDSALTDGAAAPAQDESLVSPWRSLLEDVPATPDPDGAEVLQAAFHDQLDDPGLVLSPGYVGPDRRAAGLRNRVLRATFKQRRSVLSLEFVVVAVAVIVCLATLLVVSTGGRPTAKGAQVAAKGSTRARADVPVGAATAPAAASTTVPVPTTTVPAPTTTVPAPTTTAAPAPAAAAPPAPAPAPAAAPVSDTPDQMGAQALTLVRYPWQSIPGYSIQFLPIADAPSPSFYGNTTFTWGSPGGTSDLYVYPGETVDQLAGIIAFEIGHEVDAAAVEPQGGETQIENILGIHPASWAPDCDCAEQGFLSGWYAAAFSNYWSPGVGDWSTIAPEPTGAVLAAVEPWLNPTIS